MPKKTPPPPLKRFKVEEDRMYRATYLVDAVDLEAAKHLNGTIVETFEGESHGYDLVSVQEVPPGATL